jgi:hypothetical protein
VVAAVANKFFVSYGTRILTRLIRALLWANFFSCVVRNVAGLVHFSSVSEENFYALLCLTQSKFYSCCAEILMPLSIILSNCDNFDVVAGEFLIQSVEMLL